MLKSGAFLVAVVLACGITSPAKPVHHQAGDISDIGVHLKHPSQVIGINALPQALQRSLDDEDAGPSRQHHAQPQKPKSSSKKHGQTTTKQQSSQKGRSCQLPSGHRNGKRAFSTDCDKTTLTLNGITQAITKVGEQGNSAITYKVDHGWPDPTDGKIVTAYAKTGKAPHESFETEAKWLKHTDQLLAEGEYEDRNFIVFHGVEGKVKIHDTDFFMGLYAHMHKGDVKKCEEEVEDKLELVVKEAETYVQKFGILHTDIQPGNILWDKAATDPTLIDWGKAKDVGVGKWNKKLAEQVKEQAVFSHLKGQEKLCHDLKPK